MLNINIIYNGKNSKFNEKIKVNKGEKLENIKNMFIERFEYPIMLAKINNENLELFKEISSDCDIEFLDITDKHAYMTYKRSIALLMINSIRKILGEFVQIRIKYSVNQNWYCDIKEEVITEDLIDKILNDMRKTVSKGIAIEKLNIPTKECINMLKDYKMFDRADSLKFVKKSTINLYKLENTYDYLYGAMATNTKELDKFDILKNKDNSFTLCFAKRTNPEILSEYKNIEILNKVFEESSNWANIIGIDYVSDLNNAICDEKIKDIILISEALQEKKIANISDLITKNNKKFVLIAGPSSSGKTTFAHRLSIQLKVNGINTHIISLDDYYLDRGNVPLDENGKPDFECLESLDLNKINEDLENLLKGEIVNLPKFNFVTGKREKGNSIKLKSNEIIILEGIHGLNEKISHKIEKKYKFKIFISALTQLNIDSHNRIATTDARIFRRIVRDHYFRGFGVNKTINMWENVMKGEVKHIFPFQKEADIIFNSALIYEIAVLKPFIEPLLYKISNKESEFAEATRLIKFLNNFLAINQTELIPPNSIIREFIGGSCFY